MSHQADLADSKPRSELLDLIQFMKVSEMLDSNGGFLVRDTVVFVCEVLDCCPWFDFSDLELMYFIWGSCQPSEGTSSQDSVGTKNHSEASGSTKPVQCERDDKAAKPMPLSLFERLNYGVGECSCDSAGQSTTSDGSEAQDKAVPGQLMTPCETSARGSCGNGLGCSKQLSPESLL